MQVRGQILGLRQEGRGCSLIPQELSRVCAELSISWMQEICLSQPFLNGTQIRVTLVVFHTSLLFLFPPEL